MGRLFPPFGQMKPEKLRSMFKMPQLIKAEPGLHLRLQGWGGDANAHTKMSPPATTKWPLHQDLPYHSWTPGPFFQSEFPSGLK